MKIAIEPNPISAQVGGLNAVIGERGGHMHSPVSKLGGESHPRSIMKAVSWRATGSVDTFFVSWLITANPVFAGSIAATEIVTKIVLYYLHERAWGAVHWGRVNHGPS